MAITLVQRILDHPSSYFHLSNQHVKNRHFGMQSQIRVKVTCTTTSWKKSPRLCSTISYVDTSYLPSFKLK